MNCCKLSAGKSLRATSTSDLIGKERHRREIRHRVVERLLCRATGSGRRSRHCRSRTDSRRALALATRLPPSRPPTPGDVFDHDGLPKIVADSVGDDASDGVARSAGRKGHHQCQSDASANPPPGAGGTSRQVGRDHAGRHSNRESEVAGKFHSSPSAACDPTGTGTSRLFPFLRSRKWQCRLLARSCRSRMSANSSLLGVKRTTYAQREFFAF